MTSSTRSESAIRPSRSRRTATALARWKAQPQS